MAGTLAALAFISSASLTTGCENVSEPVRVKGQVHLTLLHTSDIHSRLFPYNLQLGQVDAGLGLGQALPREPGLLFQPREGGEAVHPLVMEWVEISGRAERPPAALDKHLKSALGEGPAEEHAPGRGPAVGRPHEDHRRFRVFMRIVAVSEEHGAVGHRHLEVALDNDIPSFNRRKLERPPDESAEDRHTRSSPLGQPPEPAALSQRNRASRGGRCGEQAEPAGAAQVITMG